MTHIEGHEEEELPKKKKKKKTPLEAAISPPQTPFNAREEAPEPEKAPSGKTSIVFDPPGKPGFVEYNGKLMTRDQYKNLLSVQTGRGGKLTPGVKGILAEREEAGIRATASAIPGEKLTPEQQRTVLEQQAVQPQLQPQLGVTPGAEQPGVGGIAPVEQAAAPSIMDIFTGKGVKAAAKERGEGLIAGAAPGIGLPGAAGISIVGRAASKARSAKYLSVVKVAVSKIKNLKVGSLILYGYIASTLRPVGKALGISFFQDEAPFIQQSFNTLGQQVSEITNDPVLNPAQKLESIRFIEQEINKMAETLQINNIENRRLTNTKEMIDIQTDLFEQQQKVILGKGEVQAQILAGQFPTFDENVINEWAAGATAKEIKEVSDEYSKRVEGMLG